MPAKRLLPDNRTLKRWVDSGMTHQEIAHEVERTTGVHVSRSTVSAALSRAGLVEHQRYRYDKEIPWRVKSEHLTQYPVRMLRLLGRRNAEIEAARGAGVIAGVMHMEGAEAIDPGCDALHAFHAMGLRSLGPVWSRPTVFGHGVPFAFPASPDMGGGLTPAGQQLVRACNDLRILIDLSHLNEKGFDDVARLSTAPLVATHSNAHAITPSSRNLTDRQLHMIRDSGGMVGLNFATVFLRPDGRRDADFGWGPVLRHMDHLITHLGEDHVGFGSDFDGASVPLGIGDVAGLPRLLAALSAHGYSDGLLRKLAWDNWLSVLRRTWGA